MATKSQAEAKPSSLFKHPDNKANFELFYKYLSQPSPGIWVCQLSEGERLKIFRFFDADPLREHIHIIDMIQTLGGPMELQEAIIHTHETYGTQKSIIFIHNLEQCIYLSSISTSDFFQKLNLIRDFFMRYNILFVFFMEERTLKDMIQHAIDFYDWIVNHFNFVRESSLGLDFFLEIEDSREIKYSSPYKRISYLKKLMDTNINEREKAQNVNELANLYIQIGDKDKAMQLLLEGLNSINESTEATIKSNYYRDIGYLYQEKGDSDLALKFYHDALTIFKEMNDPSNLAYVYIQLGNLAWVKQDYLNAKNHYHEALKLYIQLNEIYEQARTYYRLGVVAESTQNFIEVADFFQKAEALKEKYDEQQGQTRITKTELIRSDFFITYHHSDEMAARWIAAELKQSQFTILSDSWDFIPGQSPIEKMVYMSTVARRGMVLISPPFIQSQKNLASWQAMNNQFVQHDHFDYKDSERFLYLVRVHDCEIQQLLGSLHYLDLANIPEAEAVKRLFQTVATSQTAKKKIQPPPNAEATEDILAKRKLELDDLLDKTIRHNYHMKLNIEGEVEKEEDIENKENGRMEKRKVRAWEPIQLETILKDGKNYLLVNPSGMGKTTFLVYAASAFLNQESHYPFLPLFFTSIALNNRSDTIDDFILRQIEALYTNSQGSLVSSQLENLCVLIDALDQARDVDDIVSSLQIHNKPIYYKKAKIILSSRQNTADKVMEGFERIRLKLPDDDEVQYYLGEESYIRLESLIHSNKELVTVPVLLEMLKTITEKGHVVSELYNRADLYSEFSKILFDEERRKPRFWQDPSYIRHFIDFELEKVLEKVAFFSLVDNKILEIEKEKLVQYCETPAKKEALLNLGILLELFEDREQKIVFRHQSFQAYFAARYIYYRQPELFQQLVSDIAFFYNDLWYEVMRFFVGLEKDLQKAEEIMDTISQPNPKEGELQQALRLIFSVFLMSEARVSHKFCLDVYKQLGDLILKKERYQNFFDSNIDRFNKSNVAQRRNILFILKMLIKNRSKDTDAPNSTIFNSTQLIHKIATDKSLPFLGLLSSVKTWDIHQTAVNQLIRFYRSLDAPIKITFNAKNSDGHVRDVKPPREIGLTTDISLRELLLGNKNLYARIDAIKKIGEMGTLKDIPILEFLLNDENWAVVQTVSQSIEQIYRRSTPHLIIKKFSPKEENIIAISNISFPSQSLHILHISDIHYALEKSPSITCIFHEFLNDIKKWRSQQNNMAIHAICLTGDIAQSGQENQYDSISETINTILNTAGCPKENLFIIPGNHDVQDFQQISELGKTLLEQVKNDKKSIDSHVLSHFENYRQFHDKFTHYYRFIENNGYLNSLPENHNTEPKPWYNRKLKDFPVRIIGLNSALFCLKGFCERGKIHMGTHPFHEAFFQGKADSIPENEQVIVLTHHPLDWLEETEYEAYSSLMERYSVIHLHGHIHKTKIEKKQRLFSSSGGYASIGTGSLYGEKGKTDINTYHIITIDFEKHELQVWARRWNPDTGRWTVYDDDSNNRFSLGMR